MMNLKKLWNLIIITTVEIIRPLCSTWLLEAIFIHCLSPLLLLSGWQGWVMGGLNLSQSFWDGGRLTTRTNGQFYCREREATTRFHSYGPGPSLPSVLDVGRRHTKTGDRENMDNPVSAGSGCFQLLGLIWMMRLNGFLSHTTATQPKSLSLYPLEFYCPRCKSNGGAARSQFNLSLADQTMSSWVPGRREDGDRAQKRRKVCRRTWANNCWIKNLFRRDGSGEVSRAKLVSSLNWRPARHEGKLHVRLVFHRAAVRTGKVHNNNSNSNGSSGSSGHIWREILSPALCPLPLTIRRRPTGQCSSCLSLIQLCAVSWTNRFLWFALWRSSLWSAHVWLAASRLDPPAAVEDTSYGLQGSNTWGDYAARTYHMECFKRYCLSFQKCLLFLELEEADSRETKNTSEPNT